MGFQDLPAEIHDMIFKTFVFDCWEDIYNPNHGVHNTAKVLNKRLVCRKFNNFISYHAIRILPADFTLDLGTYMAAETFAWILYELSISSPGALRDGHGIPLVTTIQMATRKARQLLGSQNDDPKTVSSNPIDHHDELFEDNIRKAACQAALMTIPYPDAKRKTKFWDGVGRIRSRDIAAHIRFRDSQHHAEQRQQLCSPLANNGDSFSAFAPLDSEEETELDGDLLCILAYHGDVNVIRRFIGEINVDFSRTSRWFGSPIHAAVAGRGEGANPIIQLLLERGAAVDTPVGIFSTPLQVASFHAMRETVRLLLQYGADPNSEDDDQNTAMDAVKDDATIVHMLMEHGVDLHGTRRSGLSNLHQAASFEHINVAKLLLDKGLDVNLRTRHAETPLMVAIYRSQYSAAMFFLERGAQVNVIDEAGNTPLSRATFCEQEDIVRSLLQHGADPNLIHDSYSSKLKAKPVLTTGAYTGNYTIVKMLLENGAHVRREDGTGMAALYAASQGCHLEITRLLLDHGATIDNNSNNNFDTTGYRSPLIFTPACCGNTALVRLLVENGADVLAKDDKGQTALYDAAGEGHLDTCQYLIERGCPVNSEGSLRTTPLHEGVRGCGKGVPELLLKHGAEVNALNGGDKTALHIALKMGGIRVAQLLIEAGADIHMEDEWGNTPLYHAALTNRGKIVQTLIKKGALLEKQNVMGRTPLHIAAYEGRLAAVKILLRERANPNPRDFDDVTPLGLAIRYEHAEVETLLRQNGAIE